MKKIILFCLTILFFSNYSYSQDYNSEKTTLTNFLKRMYNSAPFTGVKVVEDYENNYLISVVLLEKAKYSSSSTMNRVAQVKAQSQANSFLNGSHIDMDFVVTTTEKRSDKAQEVTVETVEKIKEKGYGFVKGLELLSNFDSQQEEGMMVFIYFKKIEDE
jgi:hypothetical protein